MYGLSFLFFHLIHIYYEIDEWKNLDSFFFSFLFSNFTLLIPYTEKIHGFKGFHWCSDSKWDNLLIAYIDQDEEKAILLQVPNNHSV